MKENQIFTEEQYKKHLEFIAYLNRSNIERECNKYIKENNLTNNQFEQMEIRRVKEAEEFRINKLCRTVKIGKSKFIINAKYSGVDRRSEAIDYIMGLCGYERNNEEE